MAQETEFGRPRTAVVRPCFPAEVSRNKARLGADTPCLVNRESHAEVTKLVPAYELNRARSVSPDTTPTGVLANLRLMDLVPHLRTLGV